MKYPFFSEKFSEIFSAISACSAVSLLFLFLWTGAALAAFDTKGWSWQSTIQGKEAPSGFVRLMITPDIFDGSQPSLQDLRVLDEAGELVPHVLHWGRTRREERVEWRSVELINRTFLPDRWVRATLDFGESIRKNRIRINLSGQNYRRRVMIEAGSDAGNWETVAEGLWLIDILQGGREFKIDTLDFPINDFRYLRLTIFNESDDSQRFEIESVQGAFHEETTKVELQPVPVVNRTVSHDEKKDETVVQLDLGFKNLPIVRLSVQPTTSYYYRGYELLGRNAEVEETKRPRESGWDVVQQKVPWQPVHSGVFYRINYGNKTSESNTIHAINAPYRYLKLRILDGDNPPLDIDNVTLFRREVSLVFRQEPGRRYTLIGGNPHALPPSYDLSRAVEGVAEFNLPIVHAGPLTPLEHEPSSLPWTERHRFVLWAVLLLAVGVMVGLIVKNLKRIGQE